MNRLSALAVAVLCLVLALGPAVRAEYNSITQTDVAPSWSTGVIAPSGTFTQTRAFTPLPRTVAQSVAVQGTGTSPNYKVEILVTLDGTNYVKPETGGDLGTFTDANWHIMAVSVPLSVAHKLKITELGGANSITVTALEASQ